MEKLLCNLKKQKQNQREIQQTKTVKSPAKVKCALEVFEAIAWQNNSSELDERMWLTSVYMGFD